MDEKELLKVTTWLEQPPRWMDPDAISEDAKAANAAAFMAAAARKGGGVRSS